MLRDSWTRGRTDHVHTRCADNRAYSHISTTDKSQSCNVNKFMLLLRMSLIIIPSPKQGETRPKGHRIHKKVTGKAADEVNEYGRGAAFFLVSYVLHIIYRGYRGIMEKNMETTM